MAVGLEREHEYILHPDKWGEVIDLLKIHDNGHCINQGMLLSGNNRYCRLRKEVHITGLTPAEYTVTIKIPEPELEGMIETVFNITQYEYHKLRTVSTDNLYKLRHRYKNYDLDSFWDENNILYFFMLEVETLNGSTPSYPEDLKDFILYSVEYGDRRFNNDRLADVSYASKLLKDIVSGEIT